MSCSIVRLGPVPHWAKIPPRRKASYLCQEKHPAKTALSAGGRTVITWTAASPVFEQP